MPCSGFYKGTDTQQRKEDILVRALCWHGKNDVRVDMVPDPEIQEPTDAIIKIISTAICGSDLHLYDGFMMEMEKVMCLAMSRWASSSRWVAR
jgi:hypothetical protein